MAGEIDLGAIANVAGQVGGGLLGGVFGGLMRLAPAVLQFFQAKADRAHELSMTRLQIDREKELGAQKLREIGAEANKSYDDAALKALVEAVSSQGKTTGIWFIDMVSQTVRPFLTYWWMTLFTAYKASALVLVYQTTAGQSIAQAMAYSWGADDTAILSGIINFWFLDRVLQRKGM